LSGNVRRASHAEALTHALPAHFIRKPTEEELTDESADGCGDFDAEFLVRVEFLALSVNIAQHGRRNIDGKDVVASRIAVFSSEEFIIDV